MVAAKYVVIILTVMMCALNLSSVLAQSPAPPGTLGDHVTGIAPQPQQQNPSYGVAPVTPGQIQTRPEVSQSSQGQAGGNTTGWPNYPYPPYHNPYYDGGTPGNLLSGAIDWVLEFPSSAWDRFSEFLDSKLFPNSAATYGGKPNVEPTKPQSVEKQPQNLPAANSYKMDSK